MKKLIAVLISFVIAHSAVYAGNPFEFSLEGDYLIPGKKDLWDKASGGTAKFTYWVKDNVGVAASVGYQQWTLNSDPKLTESVDLSSVGYYGIYGEQWEVYDGKFNVVPVGLSALYRIPLASKAKLTLEGGAKYLFVSGSANWAGIQDIYDAWTGEMDVFAGDIGNVKIGNGAVAFIGADADLPINNWLSLFAGGGYQVDIMKGKITVKDIYGDEMDSGLKNEMKAFFIRAGARIGF